jgi:nitroimidazol reductase NimA-like FMN-containing flavoprotein (pyridoxamine 5'-phosphate oxidase superfamily)
MSDTLRGMHPTASPTDGAEFIHLDRSESLGLLHRVPIGRLIFTVSALPAVRPMNFVLVDDLIVLRTAADSTVARKVDGEVVAFEVDELDVAARSGWSVVIHGYASVVNDRQTISRLKSVPLVSWAPGKRDQFITITTEMVEGRRVRHGDVAVQR